MFRSRPTPRTRRGLLAAAAVLAAVAMPARPIAAQLAVVVNPSSALTGLTGDQLQRLFLGLTTVLPDHQAVALAMYAPDAERFCQKALGHGADDVRKRWLGIAFRGDPGTPPVELKTTDAVKQFVRTHAGALAFLPLAAADASVKVVAVDGKKPGDEGYKLP